MTYTASPDRNEGKMQCRRTGRSGLDLPVLSLGYWRNFGDDRPCSDAGSRVNGVS